MRRKGCGRLLADKQNASCVIDFKLQQNENLMCKKQAKGSVGKMEGKNGEECVYLLSDANGGQLEVIGGYWGDQR